MKQLFSILILLASLATAPAFIFSGDSGGDAQNALHADNIDNATGTNVFLSGIFQDGDGFTVSPKTYLTGSGGTVKLTSGEALVNTFEAVSNRPIFLSYISANGNVSAVYIQTNEIYAAADGIGTHGTGFKIRSSNPTDDNYVSWFIPDSPNYEVSAIPAFSSSGFDYSFKGILKDSMLVQYSPDGENDISNIYTNYAGSRLVLPGAATGYYRISLFRDGQAVDPFSGWMYLSPAPD